MEITRFPARFVKRKLVKNERVGFLRAGISEPRFRKVLKLGSAKTNPTTTQMKKVLIALTFAFITGPALQAMVVNDAQVQEQEMKRRRSEEQEFKRRRSDDQEMKRRRSDEQEFKRRRSDEQEFKRR